MASSWCIATCSFMADDVDDDDDDDEDAGAGDGDGCHFWTHM